MDLSCEPERTTNYARFALPEPGNEHKTTEKQHFYECPRRILQPKERETTHTFFLTRNKRFCYTNKIIC